MDIRLETGYDSGRSTIDISIMGMNIKSLPLLNGDEIREMVRPIIENRIALETGNWKAARKLSYLTVYGIERCRESFPEISDTGQDSEFSQESPQ